MGAISKAVAKSARRILTPKRREIRQEPLTPGTPLAGQPRRAPSIPDQTGDEVPLFEKQIGAGNTRQKARETGRQEGGYDANLRDVKVLGSLAAAAGGTELISEGLKLLSGDKPKNKNFKRAFSNARKEGKKFFYFGTPRKKYNTKLLEEAAGMPIPKPRPQKKSKPLSIFKTARPPQPKLARPAQKAHGGIAYKDYRKGGMIHKTTVKRG